jgi:hypothetical protein
VFDNFDLVQFSSPPVCVDAIITRNRVIVKGVGENWSFYFFSLLGSITRPPEKSPIPHPHQHRGPPPGRNTTHAANGAKPHKHTAPEAHQAPAAPHAWPDHIHTKPGREGHSTQRAEYGAVFQNCAVYEHIVNNTKTRKNFLKTY